MHKASSTAPTTTDPHTHRPRPTIRDPRKQPVQAHEWLRAVQRSRSLSVKARAVAAALFTSMDPDGSHCWPSLDTIAERCGYSRRRAILGRRATEKHAASLGPLDELERGGWIIRLRRAGKDNGARSTAYFAVVPRDEDQNRATPVTERGSTDEGGVVPDAEQGVVPDAEQGVLPNAEHDLASDLAPDLAPKEPGAPDGADDPAAQVSISLDDLDLPAIEDNYLRRHNGGHFLGHRLHTLGVGQDDVEGRYLYGDRHPDGVLIACGWRCAAAGGCREPAEPEPTREPVQHDPPASAPRGDPDARDVLANADDPTTAGQRLAAAGVDSTKAEAAVRGHYGDDTPDRHEAWSAYVDALGRGVGRPVG